MHHAKVTFSWKSVHRRICDYVLKLLKWSSAAAKRTDKTCKVNRPNLISWEMHGCMDGVKHRGRIGCQETQSACVTTRKLRVWKHIDNESRGTNKLTNKKSTLKTKKKHWISDALLPKATTSRCIAWQMKIKGWANSGDTSSSNEKVAKHIKITCKL